MQNLVKIGLSRVELMHLLNFQNGGRPPSWIWCDVIADMFARYHDFYIWPIWLEIDYLSPFWGRFEGDMTGFLLELGTGARVIKTTAGATRRLKKF